MNWTSVMSPLGKLRVFDGAFPGGVRYAVTTRNVAALTPDVVSALLEAYASRHSPGVFVNVHHFHGAGTRVGADHAAFGERRPHHLLELIETAPSERPLSDWSRRASTMLAPYSLPGGYPNLLGPDDRGQAAEAYGEHAARLLAVKRRLDPDGVFTATPLPTAP